MVPSSHSTDLSNQRIVFPEGSDILILQAARKLRDEFGISPILIGSLAAVEKAAKAGDIGLNELSIEDPGTSCHLDAMATDYSQGQRALKPALVMRMLQKPMFFGARFLHLGLADAMIAGVATPTKRVIESGLMCIGLEQGIKAPSSFFLMRFPIQNEMQRQDLFFADCALNIDPTAEELCGIAYASAMSASKIIGRPANVSFLSFSTQGSGSHASVDKVREAVNLLRERCPELYILGEVQADAALNSVVAAKKLHGDVARAGKADVLIFPDLNSANISYKLVQELACAKAIGPILQGFRKPIADLSRGASVQDIVDTAWLTLNLR